MSVLKRKREVLTDWEAPGWDEIAELAAYERSNSANIDRRLRASGVPTALIGGLAGLAPGGNVPTADGAAITGGTSNVAMWESRLYTPIAALETAPTQFELLAAGLVTSSAGSQTITINPHIGTSNTVGTNLTASSAQTLGSTITNAIWQLAAQITVRTAGPGTSATAIGTFTFSYTTAANVGAPTIVMWRSTANATFDSTVLNGLVIGETPSAAGVSVTVQQIQWVSIG